MKHCLSSIGPALSDRFRLSRLCVVDNASTDNSMNELQEFDLPLHIFQNESNRGFAAACNQGAHGTHATYLLFLNPDTRLSPSSLTIAITFMEDPQNQRIGICGVPLLDNSSQPSTCSASFPSPLSMCIESCGLSRLFGTPRFAAYSEAEWSHGNHLIVDQVIGAFFLVRSSVFTNLAGFDEKFFMYFEEVDFSLRAKADGHASCLVFGTRVWHTGGVSSQQVKDLRLFYSLRSKLQYARKHFSPAAQLTVLIFTLLVEPLARCIQGFSKSPLATFSVIFHAYRRLGLELISRSVHKRRRRPVVARAIERAPAP